MVALSPRGKRRRRNRYFDAGWELPNSSPVASSSSSIASLGGLCVAEVRDLQALAFTHDPLLTRNGTREDASVAAFGSGSGLWRVDVVLRLSGAPTDAETQILALLGSWQEGLPSSNDDRVHPSLQGTYSFDIAPPDGQIGVSCWVRADGVGEAAQLAHDIVSRAYTQTTGRDAELWDLRLLPRSAITGIRDIG
jgi:hypothetical protein